MTYEITDAVTNRQITTITSFLEVGYKGESNVSRYPIEQGGFFSANKVASPWSLPLKIAITGTPDRLRAILSDLKTYEDGVGLVNVTTPFWTYLDGNIERLDWALKENGATGLLQVELGIIEIRQVEPRYTSVSVPPKRAAQVKNKSDASTEERGKQQPENGNESFLEQLTGRGKRLAT
ncbi:hypothetical protein NNO07_22485 [Pseudomonas resinovorans]|uniref:Dit-like phage tail protein N-terminal domain-containing protein n=1 Tax=Metapseudomonas resinovorans TaxID=53412 RepID=A0ABT4YB29_METRE|nr:hypothetical protein [Pseudomonas resinovorans]MDA8485844.1 hypothetical protein [Pseudomonas resinovorans]